MLTWSSVAGVTGYDIVRGVYNPATGTYTYTTIKTVSPGVTTFTDIGGIVSGNGYNNVYEVIADFGSYKSLSDVTTLNSLQSFGVSTNNLHVSAQLIRNQTGHWQLMFSYIPPSVQKIAFYWYTEDYFGDLGTPAYPTPDTYQMNNGMPLTMENDIPVTNIINGVYVLPDFLLTNWFPNSSLGKVAMVRPIGTNNQYGPLCQAGYQPFDTPVFMDGRTHMKQNLLYELRAATISQRNTPLYEANVYLNPFYYPVNIPGDTNYVESSIFHWGLMYGGSQVPQMAYLQMDDLWPIEANYELFGGLYDTNYTGTPFVWQPDPGDDYAGPDLEFQGTLTTTPAPAILGISDPYWISQSMTNWADLAAYTSSGNLYLRSGIKNLFGLTFMSALVNQGGYDINLRVCLKIQIT